MPALRRKKWAEIDVQSTNLTLAIYPGLALTPPGLACKPLAPLVACMAYRTSDIGVRERAPTNHRSILLGQYRGSKRGKIMAQEHQQQKNYNAA